MTRLFRWHAPLMKLRSRKLLLAGVAFLACVPLLAAWVRTVQAPSTAALPLAAYARSGALLSIESPHFADLLSAWTHSPEERRWIAGDDYAAFSRSRLFDRLGQAQNEFAATAGLPADTRFLQQIAGGDSLLAWYDIGQLEFLYITRLPSGQAARTPLLQLRDRFEQRSAGGTAFYVRTQTNADTGASRTVAFAVRGDLLLLATRADLLATSLELMEHPTDRNVGNDPWYRATLGGNTVAPDLSMALNLAVIVHSPYFRSYWVQRNITETKGYTAARSDLFRNDGDLREERVLLPVDTAAPPPSADFAALLQYLPQDRGVYNAQAVPTAQAILSELDDKLLVRAPSAYTDPLTATVADLSTPVGGSASALEERIDATLVASASRAAALAPLHDLLNAASPSAMLSFSTAAAPAQGRVFAGVHTAVLLAAPQPWDAARVQQAVSAALAPSLTALAANLRWSERTAADATVHGLDGLHGLAFAARGNVLVLASDQATLQSLLAAYATARPTQPAEAISLAGFHLHAETGAFNALVSHLDHRSLASASADENAAAADSAGAPPFFYGNMVSLGNTFRDLDTETVREFSTPDHTVHQTVLYTWKR